MSYNPDRNARPTGKLFTRQLSQRDLSLSIPVNYVEHAAVSLTAACFARRRYVTDEAERCFSNLLAIGFHRYEVDVYWDVSRQLWSLCPVEVRKDGPRPDEPASAGAAAATTGQQTDVSIVAMSSDEAQTRRDVEEVKRRQATATDSQLNGMTLAQASASTSMGQGGASVTTPIFASESSPSSSSMTTSTDTASYRQIGAYECSESADVNWLSRVLWTYLDTTETNLNATLRYLILNLHAAGSASDGAEDAQEPSADDLPGSDDLLSSLIASNLSSFLYTPINLQEQRANINDSWYDVPMGLDTVSGYYSTSGPEDRMSTPNGWPSENYVEMQEGKRLFVGFGTIDEQMQSYDISRDSSTIFPQDYLQRIENLVLDPTGEVTSGCFYRPNDYSISGSNNSWIFAVNANAAGAELLYSSSNITRCGVSPILNVTLSDTTAAEDFVPYQTWLQSTIWSWAPDYPVDVNGSQSLTSSNDGQISNDDDDNGNDVSNQARCAALNATSGFWQNVICDSVHYSACRREGSIYDWSISSDHASYLKAGLSCRDDSEFDVPRTGLQNTYLLNTWRARLSDLASDSDFSGDELLWLNFNNLDSELCWVVGQNSTCPYVHRRSDARQVVVPVVAAVVVFALGVLTIFVKCAANRRMNKRQKRRRRGDDGWDYEGVPS